VQLADVYEYLAIPYVAVFYSIELDNGEWVRRAEYPELGCVIEAVSEPDLMERLEDERVRTIVAMCERGEIPPCPRPPLQSGVSGLSELPLARLFERATGILA
jgi:hypothetical protein